MSGTGHGRQVNGTEQNARFWDRVAERYSKKPVPDEAAYQKKLRITREYFRPDMEVLELGCGTGSTAIAHAPYVKRIRAVDFSLNMIEIAREKARAANVENVVFERSGIDEYVLPDESVDAILALSVLHLLENKDEVIAGVHRMLKPGGVFVTSTACITDMMKLFNYVAPIGRFFGLMPFVAIFSRRELRDSLTGAGFEIDREWQPDRKEAVFIVARKTA